jgi:rubrerythrin
MDNPVKIAIKMEMDGIAFYEKAADKTKNPLGKKMFLSFIEDEKNHLKALDMIFKGASFDLIDDIFKGSDPRKRIKTVFSMAEEDRVLERQKADTDELMAIEIAMELEKQGYDYYVEVAGDSENEEIKKLFEILAGEENQHYTMLQNSHTYLTDTGNWFIWEERAMIDGG